MSKLGKTQSQLAIEKGCEACGYIEAKSASKHGLWRILKQPEHTFDWDIYEYRVPTEIAVLCSKFQHRRLIEEINCDLVMCLGKNTPSGKWIPLSKNCYVVDWDLFYYREVKGDENPDTDEPVAVVNTKDTIDKVEVMTAFLEGTAIQFINNYYTATGWADLKNPTWDWKSYDYRIKPEPKLRPLTSTELVNLMHTTIVCKNDEFISSVIGVNTVECSITTVDQHDDVISVDAKELLESYVTFDNKPLGVKE